MQNTQAIYQTDMVGQRELPYANPPLVNTIQHCEAHCEHMITHLTCHYGNVRFNQIQLLRDCADTCGLTAEVIARNSCYAKVFAAFCAQICELCGNECLRYPDAHSQYCAQICLHCAQACRAFAAM
jgi:hypothetical protein